MATYFGEVLPLSSRAVEEEEELDIPVGRVDFIYEDATKVLPSLDCLLIAEGLNAFYFVVSYIKKDNALLARLKYSPSDDHSNSDQLILGLDYSRATQYLGELYLSESANGNVMLLVCEHKFPAEFLTSTLHEILKDTEKNEGFKMFALASERESNFISDDEYLSFPIIRSLSTPSFTEYPTAQMPLEQPNVISGFAAATLDYAIAFDIPALVLICYTDVDLDSLSIKSFAPILLYTPLQELRLNKAEDIEENILRSVALKSQGNLYT